MERQQLLERENFWAGKAICASADTKVHVTTKSRKTNKKYRRHHPKKKFSAVLLKKLLV